jgi:hypothetical protein
MKFNYYALTGALLPVLTIAGLMIPGFANATTTTYLLSNHPESGGAPNPETVSHFGLRLDGLLTGSYSETYLFDFDQGNMQLTYDDVLGTIEISGTAFGYQNDNSDGSIIAGTEAMWTINFLYDMNVGISPDETGGALDLSVGAPGHVNFGTISGTVGTTEYNFELRDHYSDNHGTAFTFGDEIPEFAPVLTGWGWLDYCNTAIADECTADQWRGSDQNYPDTPFPYTADWLFTPVPVPAAAWLFGSGLIGLIAAARRKI